MMVFNDASAVERPGAASARPEPDVGVVDRDLVGELVRVRAALDDIVGLAAESAQPLPGAPRLVARDVATGLDVVADHVVARGPLAVRVRADDLVERTAGLRPR